MKTKLKKLVDYIGDNLFEETKTGFTTFWVIMFIILGYIATLLCK